MKEDDLGSCQATLRICQLNILAPSARICEPLKKQPWRDRHSAICDTLESLSPDIISLQEFDFSPKTEGFSALYQERLGSHYEIFMKKRTRHKVDGLALLVKRKVFSEISVEEKELKPQSCDRVALVANLVHTASGQRLSVINTHLTVAHVNGHDIPKNRPMQMEQVLEAAGKEDDTLSIIAADLNSDHLEPHSPPPAHGFSYTVAQVARPVYMAFEAGYTSALHETLGPAIRPMSHTCSYAQDGCADYILYRGQGLSLSTAYLWPPQIAPDHAWDHAQGWGGMEWTLSDHRPIVVDFSLAARC
jgi:endonuclease/exonuclease/phosphatase family metal-dependent hydrolase